MEKVFKDFEGDELRVQVTSCIWIDTDKSTLVFHAKTAKEIAEFILNAIAEKEKIGGLVDL